MTAVSPKAQESCTFNAPTATDHSTQPKGAGPLVGRRHPEDIRFRTSEPVKIPKPPFQHPNRTAETDSVLHAKILSPGPIL